MAKNTDTILVMYMGEADSVQNRFGRFTRGVAVELTRAAGEGVLKYPCFQEAEKEKGKKGGE